MKNFRTKCPICGAEFELEMTNEQYEKYINGEDFIQDIFPDWTPGQREMLITGICDECWKRELKIDK